jgi:diguanylate cyclase (GGDEF)-like protein/PAS domain S-box-containing protein
MHDRPNEPIAAPAVARAGARRSSPAPSKIRDEAEQQRQFLDAVLDIAGALVCVFDGEGRILRFNRACERLTGYTFAEVRGRRFYDFLVPPAEIPAVEADLAALQPGQAPAHNENNWVTRDGQLRLISWSDVCFFDDAGRVTHLISTGIDVTDERRAERALQGIEAVGTLLATTGPTTESLTAVLTTLSERMGYPRLAVFLRRAGRLELRAAVDSKGAARPIDPTDAIVDEVVSTKRSVLASGSVAALADRAAISPAATDAASQMAVPLVVDDVVEGVIGIESTPELPLGERDVRLVETVAQRLSVALVLGREQQALKERARLFAAVNAFARATGGMVDEDLLPASLLEEIARVVTCDAAWLTLVDQRKGRHIVRAIHGTNIDRLAVGKEVRATDRPDARAARRQSLVVERLGGGRGKRPTAIPWAVTSGSMVAVPLVHDAVVLGSFVVCRTGSKAEFTSLEREVLELLGAQAALAATNARLLAEVRALAIRDPLTGLFNRRHFDAAAELILARWRRDRDAARPIAAIMFDLDHFGDLNNTYGHQVGDAVLREFAGILLTRFRSADLVARYGGEEFVVVLDGANLANATRAAEEIRGQLESRTVRAPDGQLVRATVSGGCAEIDPKESTREALIESADQALYEAKRSGRNRISGGSS